MSTIRKCRSCGAEVPLNAPFGHCPKCLLDLGFGPLPDAVETPPRATSGKDRVFGDYELLEQIGRGGMGIVYKARQVALNRLVALKMVTAGEFASPMVIERFHREAEAAANLHHPNIVPIYETGEQEGQHFFSMELIQGTSLDRHIGRDGFNHEKPAGDAKSALRRRQEHIARIMAKVARAVDYAHQHGVLHRDLKPSNVVLDQAGDPHLTDFGVAKVLGQGDSSLTATGAIMGTPSYMAPEQATGQSKRITTAADVYSLGAILYSMLTGNPPFRGDTPVETLRQVVEQEPKHPSTLKDGIDCDLATIAMKCLEKTPSQRYPSAAALADDVERWLRKEPIQARPIYTPERFWRWCRRNPNVATLGVSVVLLLVTVAVGATVLALRIQALNHSIGNVNQHLRKELAKVYSDPGKEEYLIDAETRHALLGGDRVVAGPGPLLRLTCAVYVYEHPTNMLETFAPILESLEGSLRTRLSRAVAIDLRILKSYDVGYQSLETNEWTFGRCGPASYVYLLERAGGVRLLAMQDHKKPLTSVIFARNNSDVAQLLATKPNAPLSELFGNRSLALSHTNSTTGNFMPKWFLVGRGIHAGSFKRCVNVGAQRRVIDAVLHGEFDLGAANAEIVEDYPGLVPVAKIEVSDLGLCWVAGAKLEDTMASHLQRCLLELRDPAVLGKLESKVTGFKTLHENALNGLRQIIHGAVAFDSTNH